MVFDVYEINTMQSGDCSEFTDDIFFAGCTVRCPYCFNKKLWNQNSGKPMTVEQIIAKIQDSPSKWVAYLGGEPMEQPLDMLYDLTEAIHKIGKKVIMFTSYPPIKLTLPNIDVYHIDVKLFLDYDYAPLYKMKNISFGLVATGEDVFSLDKFSDIISYPIYIKLDIKLDNQLILKNTRNILLEMGATKLYYDKKINIGVYNER
jgi:organic radical activating enzyme